MIPVHRLSDIREGQRNKAARRFNDSFAGDQNSGCWLWLGTLTRQGYGTIHIGSKKDGSRRTMLAHRFSYELNRGPIPDGMYLDHRVCRTKACVNANHLVVCTFAENMQQPDGAAYLHKIKTHCPRGHEFTESNIGHHATGGRFCLTCARQAGSRYKERVRIRLNKPKYGVGGFNKAKTECVRGHSYSAENTYIRKSGGRVCRACARLRKEGKI